MTEEHLFTATEIDAAWMRGFLVAVGTLIGGWGTSTQSEHLILSSGITRELANSLDLTEYDLKHINQQFDEIEAKELP